jgi:Mor family transcriptional regulator
MTDIITSIISEVQSRVSSITPEIALDIERKIRKRFGGEQAYIAKRCAIIDSKKQTINNELCAGRSIAQIEQLHGIPRRTIYRLINSKKEGSTSWQD